MQAHLGSGSDSVDARGAEPGEARRADGDTDAVAVQGDVAPDRDGVRPDSDLERVPIDDSVGLYFAEIGRVPLLTREEEIELAKRMEDGQAAAESLSRDGQNPSGRETLTEIVRRGEEARRALIRANTRLVVSIAKRYQHMGLPLLDLVQAGNLGLIRAADKYDYHRGTKFSTVATWWIRQAVTRSLSKHGRTIRLPTHVADEIRRMRRTAWHLAQTLGAEPTPEEIAENLGDVTEDDVLWLLRKGRRPVSLESPIGDEGDDELGSLIEDADSPSPTDSCERELLRDDVLDALRDLPPREARALRMRYGLDGDRPLSLKEIGDRMGVTRERARQIIVRALRRLRHPRRSRHLLRYLR